MTDLAALLKSEIARISRKTFKQEVSSLRSTAAQQRKQIAALKSQLLELQRAVAKLQKQAPARAPKASADGDAESTPRFSAKGLRSHRAKLGLSAENYAKLAGVSGLSIYKWEAEKSHPRSAQIRTLAGIRQLGKRAALDRLSELEAT